MRVALVYGGQPRFTYDFIDFMNRLTGFESADFYMTLWRSAWATNDEQAVAKISKVLKPNFRIGRIKVIDAPQVEYAVGAEKLQPAKPQNTLWWYERGFYQAIGTSLAFDLIDQQYDLVIKFRGDGSVDRGVDLRRYDFSKTPLLQPSNGQSGYSDYKINDQFAIGTPEAMKFYCDLGKEYKELVPASDPEWNKSSELDAWHWRFGIDFLMGYRAKLHGVVYHNADFGYNLNTYGRSQFTDKHYHHAVAKDPTEE